MGVPGGAVAVEDDGGGEVRVAEAGGAGDPVFGGDFERELAQLLGRDLGRHPAQLPADLDHRLVEEGRRPGDELDRLQFGQLGAGPGDRLRPRRQLAREAALEPQQLAEVGGQQQVLEVAPGEDDDRVFAEDLAQVLGRPVGGGVGVDQGVGARRRSGSVVASAAAASASTAEMARTPLACLATQAAVELNPSRAGRSRPP